MELKQSQKEEEFMKQVQLTMKKGKAEIAERFEELTEKFTDGLEREKRLVEAQYVSSYLFLLCTILLRAGSSIL